MYHLQLYNSNSIIFTTHLGFGNKKNNCYEQLRQFVVSVYNVLNFINFSIFI